MTAEPPDDEPDDGDLYADVFDQARAELDRWANDDD